MKTSKSKLEKRIKLLQIGLVLNILLVLFAGWQLFFEEPANFRKATHWIVFILWTVIGILNRFQLRVVKKELKKESSVEKNLL